VQVVCPGVGRAAAVQQPAQHHSNPELIPQQAEVTLSRGDRVQIIGRRHQIDDRLGSQAGHCRVRR
jgi:hypothetical protein